MRDELQKDIFNAYPEMFKEFFNSHSTSSMKYGIQVEDGWFMIVKSMCQSLDYCCKCNEILYPVFLKIKEKYGSLEVEINSSNEEFEKILLETKDKASHICEYCGKKGIGLKTIDMSDDVKVIEPIMKMICSECFTNKTNEFKKIRVQKANELILKASREINELTNTLISMNKNEVVVNE